MSTNYLSTNELQRRSLSIMPPLGRVRYYIETKTLTPKEAYEQYHIEKINENRKKLFQLKSYKDRKPILVQIQNDLDTLHFID